MSDQFQNRYRIQSARAPWWDYSHAGAYFITICTHNREHYFGEIENGIMKFSEIGKNALTEWEKTAEIRADMNVKLGEFVVMPNHFHGIIIIGDNDYNSNKNNDMVLHHDGRDAMHRVSTGSGSQPQNQFGKQSKNVASIIRGFKSAVTHHAKKLHIEFAWQTRFHDRIIRDADEYDRITEYIQNNPEKWEMDRFYTL